MTTGRTIEDRHFTLKVVWAGYAQRMTIRCKKCSRFYWIFVAENTAADDLTVKKIIRHKEEHLIYLQVSELGRDFKLSKCRLQKPRDPNGLLSNADGK